MLLILSVLSLYSYTEVIELLRSSKGPAVLEEALRANDHITTIFLQIAPKGDSANPESRLYDFGIDWAKPNSVLAKMIGAMPCLENLVINSANTFQDYSERDIVIAYFLGSVRQISSLTLQIQNCGAQSAFFFDQALMNHPSLEAVHYQVLCTDQTQQEEFYPFPSCLLTLPKLDSITVGCDESEGKELKLLGFAAFDLHASNRTLNVEPSLSLTQASFQHCGWDEHSIHGLVRTMQVNSNLKVLDVSCPADAPFFNQLAKCAPQLTHLTISAWSPDQYQKGDTKERAMYALGLSHLLSSLPKCKHLLKFASVQFAWTDSQIQLLQNYLNGKPAALQSLSLNFGQGSDIHDDSWFAFAKSLARSKLQNLDLKLWGFRELTNEGLREGHIELGQSPTITSYSIKVDGSKYNYLPRLIKASHFQSLQCEGVWFTVEFGEKLLDALQQNYSLVDLNIKYGKLPTADEQEEALAIEKMKIVILKLNQHGRHYMKHNKSSKKKGVALLAEIASQPVPIQYLQKNSEKLETADLCLDCLYFHISENPSLCEETPKPVVESARGKLWRSTKVQPVLPEEILESQSTQQEQPESEEQISGSGREDSMRLLQKSTNTRHLEQVLPEKSDHDPLNIVSEEEQVPETSREDDNLDSDEEEGDLPDSAVEI